MAVPDDDYEMVLSPDGQRLAIANAEGVFIWDVSDHTMPRRSPVPLRTWSPLEKAWALAFLSGRPDPGVAVVGSPVLGRAPSPAAATVDGREAAADHAVALAWSPDGRGLAVGLNACGVLVYCRD